MWIIWMNQFANNCSLSNFKQIMHQICAKLMEWNVQLIQTYSTDTNIYSYLVFVNHQSLHISWFSCSFPFSQSTSELAIFCIDKTSGVEPNQWMMLMLIVLFENVSSHLQMYIQFRKGEKSPFFLFLELSLLYNTR